MPGMYCYRRELRRQRNCHDPEWFEEAFIFIFLTFYFTLASVGDEQCC